MKRGLVFSLCALALVAGATAAQAQTNNVDISLNLRFTQPDRPDLGGRWFLMAQSDAAFGIAGISAYISNINLAGITLGNATAIGSGANAYPVVPNTLGATGLNGNVLKPDNSPFATAVTGGVNLVYGQDLATISPNVGKGAGTPGNVATDPLRNAAWNNSALIASGTFAGGGTRVAPVVPAFITVGSNSTDANVFASATAGQAALDATVTTVVRGDANVAIGLPGKLGSLLFGDRNRNGTVGFTTDINPALGQIGTGAGKTWDDGDFNGNGSVGFTTDINPALANIGVAAPPAPVAAVPEPAALGMIAAAMSGLFVVRRRK